MRKRIFALLCGVLLGAVCTAAAGAVTLTTTDTFKNPVADGADPFVLLDDGVYYLYSTNDGANGYIVYTSTDLVNWQARGYAMKKNGAAQGSFWAPEVIREGDTYYMVYTSKERIGIAVSDSPLGPFIDKSGSLFSDGKIIDGHFFRDDDGKVYLYFVSIQGWTHNGYTATSYQNVWVGEFDLESCKFVDDVKMLLTTEDVQNGTAVGIDAEGPEVVKHGNTYYLTYSSPGYGSPIYAVGCATSKSPFGPFEKKGTVLITADPDRTDPQNNLYGVGHHGFVKAPDGGLAVVYHAHRSGAASPLMAEMGKTNHELYVTDRRVCVDRVWFDADGNLCMGDVNNVGHPTVRADKTPFGASATREIELDDNFAALAALPTVYVAMYAGLDTNDGSAAAPFRTLDRAYAALKKGGTIVLLERYDMQSTTAKKYKLSTENAVYVSPKVDGPVLIRGAYSSVPVLFKFWSISSDTYLENLELRPRLTGALAGGYSIIECGQNNVVIGEGVSCVSRPNSGQFPVLVGGYWQYSGTSKSAPYSFYTADKRPDTMLQTDKAYTLTVKGGTWETITAGSMKDTVACAADTAKNAALRVESGATIRPGKVGSVTVSVTAAGAVLHYPAAANAEKYRITDSKGNVVGYSETTTFTDTSFRFGDSRTYTVAGYANGACIGDRSTAVTAKSDADGDGKLTVRDALACVADAKRHGTAVSAEDLAAMLDGLTK